MQDNGSLVSKVFHGSAIVLAAIAGLNLLFMVALIAIGVGARFLFSWPILGVNEIVQFVSVVCVMLALPYCTLRETHVRVDVLDELIGRWGRLLGDILSRLLSASVLGVLVWRAWLKTLDAHEFGDATNMLSLPIWPSYGMIALGGAICVAILLFQTVVILSGKSTP